VSKEKQINKNLVLTPSVDSELQARYGWHVSGISNLINKTRKAYSEYTEPDR